MERGRSKKHFIDAKMKKQTAVIYFKDSSCSRKQDDLLVLAFDECTTNFSAYYSVSLPFRLASICISDDESMKILQTQEREKYT